MKRPAKRLRGKQEGRQRLYGSLFLCLAVILLGGAVVAPVPELVVRVLLGLAAGLAVAALAALVQHLLLDDVPPSGKLIDVGIVSVAFAAGAVLLVVALGSSQIIFSSSRVACGSGLEAVPVDEGEALLLSWRDAGLNTYCRIVGPYPVSEAQRLVLQVSNLDLPGARASFKVDSEGVHLPLSDPADANREIVDALWAHLRSGDIVFALPGHVILDRRISDLTLSTGFLFAPYSGF